MKMSMPSGKIHALVTKKIPMLKRETVARGYVRLQRAMSKLAPVADRRKKTERFFSEQRKFYYPRLQASTVDRGGAP